MKNIKSLCIRFNLLKNKDKAAWDVLHNFDKKKWKSYSNAVILSVIDFFNRQEKIENDPYFETREREEKFVGEIVTAVENAVKAKIPEFLSVCFGEILRQYGERSGSNPVPVPAPTVEAASENEPTDKNDYLDFDIDFMN